MGALETRSLPAVTQNATASSPASRQVGYALHRRSDVEVSRPSETVSIAQGQAAGHPSDEPSVAVIVPYVRVAVLIVSVTELPLTVPVKWAACGGCGVTGGGPTETSKVPSAVKSPAMPMTGREKVPRPHPAPIETVESLTSRHIASLAQCPFVISVAGIGSVGDLRPQDATGKSAAKARTRRIQRISVIGSPSGIIEHQIYTDRRYCDRSLFPSCRARFVARREQRCTRRSNAPSAGSTDVVIVSEESHHQ